LQRDPNYQAQFANAYGNLGLKPFDPFFTTKPVGKGIGLGMSISYQIIVERHNGTISCKSLLGEGTTFMIELPTVSNSKFNNSSAHN
jgi:nitrogen-specific signal transduction histidine kinase